MDPAEATQTFWEWFKEKTTSPLYLTYIASFVVWNWKFFTILIFQDSTILGMSKVAYIESFIFDKLFFQFLWPSIPFWLNSFLSNRLYELVPPIVLTWFILYLLPPIANRVHKDSLKHYFARQGEYQRQKNQSRQFVLTSKVEEKKLVERTSEVRKEIEEAKKNLSEEEKWEFEYKLLQERGANLDIALTNAERIMYGSSGYFNTSGTGHGEFIPIGSISLLDSVGLLEIDSNRMKFTNKGKYFLRLSKSK